MSFEPPSLPAQEIKERKGYQEVQQSLSVFMLHLSLIGGPCLKAQPRRGVLSVDSWLGLLESTLLTLPRQLVDEKASSLEGRVADGVDGSTLGFVREETPGTTLTSGPSASHPLPLLRLPSLRFAILLVGMDQCLDSSEKKHQAQH